MDISDIVRCQRADIERLQLLLDAEKKHTARLYAAISALRESNGQAYGVLSAASASQVELPDDVFDRTMDDMNDLTDKVEELLLPTAL